MVVDWSAVLAVLSVYVAGVVIPGPNFVAVAHKAVSSSRHDALAMVAGVVSVSLFWATCTILGVGIVFSAFPWLAFGVKIAGAAYLIWFGLRLILKAGPARTSALAPDMSRGLRHAYLQGFATNIANPKSMAFFAAVFASAMPAHVSWGTFCAMLAVVGMIGCSWYGFVALALSHAGIAAVYRRGKRSIDRVCGGLIVGLGVRQLLR
jgi:threonine efflux protein